MLQYIDGFDHYAPTTESAANITAYLQAAGYVVANAAQGSLNIADGQDANSKGLKLSITAGTTPPNVSRTFNSTGDKVVFGFSFRGTVSRQRIARINGTIDLLWNADTGKLQIGAVQGPDVIIMNAFWFIEIELDKTALKARIYANNTLQLEVDLPGGAVSNTHTLMWGLTGTITSAAVMEFDDLYFLDNSGGTNNARLGPIQVITRAPNADVKTEWNAVGSTGTHASIAAQLSPNTANAPYLQANVAAREDQFTSNTVLPNDNQVYGVQLVSYARKGDLDDRSLGLKIATTGGETEVPVALTTTFGYRTAMFEQAPGAVAWNQNRVESSMFGIVAR